MSSEQLSTSSETNSTLESNSQSRWNIKTILLSIMLIALIGTWGYIIWDKNNTRELITQKDANNEMLTKKRDQLQKDLEDITQRYDNIKSANVQKDSIIIARDQEISGKQKRITILLSKQNATSAELAEARQLIETLKNDISGYENEIALLKLKNSELNSMNDKLIEQRDKVRKDYDSSLQEIKEKDKVIDIGSTLQASNFNITPLDERKNGKTVETTKAKKVYKLRISFDLNENMIAKSGIKQLYIVLTDPAGKVVADATNGSSSFKNREGETINYTQAMEINYVQNKRQTISFDWGGSGKFETGTYKLEVYNNGFKIGEGIRPLKKNGGLF